MAFIECGQGPFQSAIPIPHPGPKMVLLTIISAMPVFVPPAVICRCRPGVNYQYAYHDFDI
ncbi:MAG: hypothetical protein PsegKO_08770 [Pseudohongiellaceae bacterium]